MKMELTEYSETSAYKILTPGKHPKVRKFPTYTAYEDETDNVPKRRHIKF